MFGYIKASKPELRVREYEVYKAVYCSLCRRLGRSYGVLARFTLSYDFTFLALLRLGLQDGCDCFEKKRCCFNPFKKCNYCKNDEALEFPAAAAMILLYYKLRDNISDEKGFKKLGYTVVLPLFRRAWKKAGAAYPKAEKIAAEYFARQNKLEAENCRELDAAADPTAQMLSSLLMLCSEDEGQRRVLSRIGYCLGRYIYLLDAACDLPDDLKRNGYNVLSFDYSGDPAEYAKERVTPQLYFCINEAAKASELLELKKYRPILGNILYLGLEETFQKEFAKK